MAEDMKAAAKRLVDWESVSKAGVQPKPRAILLGLGHQIGPALSSLFPTARQVGRLEEVEQSEYDLTISFTPVPGVMSSHYVVGFGSENFPPPELPDDAPTYDTLLGFWGQISRAKELGWPPNLPEPISRMVTEQLVPLLQATEENLVLSWTATIQDLPSVEETIIEPFVFTKKREVLAGRFRRRGEVKAECWCLPRMDDKQAIECVKVALEVWREQDPKTFPFDVDWHRSPEWRTPQEDKFERELAVLRDRRVETLKELETTEATIQAKLKATTASADADERMLLTAQGDELKSAVQSCLDDLGFQVTDVDTRASPGTLLEDLRAKDPTHPGWVSLVEVRGYKGGAKVNDLMRLERFATRFAAEENRPPDARWYVVNQLLGRNPSERQPALQSNPEELETFASGGGLVIDTADLFRLWKSVAVGSVSKEEALRQLREASGRFSFPPPL